MHTQSLSVRKSFNFRLCTLLSSPIFVCVRHWCYRIQKVECFSYRRITVLPLFFMCGTIFVTVVLTTLLLCWMEQAAMMCKVCVLKSFEKLTSLMFPKPVASEVGSCYPTKVGLSIVCILNLTFRMCAPIMGLFH